MGGEGRDDRAVNDKTKDDPATVMAKAALLGVRRKIVEKETERFKLREQVIAVEGQLRGLNEAVWQIEKAIDQ